MGKAKAVTPVQTVPAKQAGKLPVSQAGRDTTIGRLVAEYLDLSSRVRELEDNRSTLGAEIRQYIQDHALSAVDVAFVGVARLSEGYEQVSYDKDALEALIASDDKLARVLVPHRTTKQVAGRLTVTAAK